MGVESGSERIRALLRKPIDEAALLDANRRLGKYPIVPLYFFMMGLPTETREDVARTVRLFCRLLEDNPRASKSLNIYSPYPGTELFDVAVRYGLKVPGRTEEWSGFNYRNLSADRPWISPEMRRLIGMLDFCSFFVGNFYPYKKTRSLARLAVRLYAPLARWRVKHLADRFPVEIQLAKLLRLYAKQE